jgi:hypothetical protein
VIDHCERWVHQTSLLLKEGEVVHKGGYGAGREKELLKLFLVHWMLVFGHTVTWIIIIITIIIIIIRESRSCDISKLCQEGKKP